MAEIVSKYTNEEGHEIVVYASGAERDVSAGHMIKPPPSTLITAENATALTRKRWEKFRQSSNSRIIREASAIDPSVRTPADAYGLLVSKQYVALMDYDKPRIDELEKLGEIMAGGSMHSKAEPGGAAVAAAGVAVGVAAAIERVMRDIMAAQARVEVIDASESRE